MQSLSAISLDDYIGFVNIAIVPFAVIEIGILYPVVPLDREQAIAESPGIEYAVQHAVTEHTVFTCLSVVAHFATTTGLVLVDELKLLRLGIDWAPVLVLPFLSSKPMVNLISSHEYFTMGSFSLIDQSPIILNMLRLYFLLQSLFFGFLVA